MWNNTRTLFTNDLQSKCRTLAQNGLFSEAFDAYIHKVNHGCSGDLANRLEFLQLLFPNGEFIAPVLQGEQLKWAHIFLRYAYYFLISKILQLGEANMPDEARWWPQRRVDATEASQDGNAG